MYNSLSENSEKLAEYTGCKRKITYVNDVDNINSSLYSEPLIYFHSKKSIEPLNDDSLNDNDFHIRFHRNVLRYQRNVEYCQWIEHFQVSTDNETRLEEKTYFYAQRWYPNPVSSVRYNEALSHVNPQRHPYSSKTVTLSQAKIGKLIFNEDLIEQLYDFKSITDDNDIFIEPAGKYASAYNEHQFEYIGNGRFHSQYEKVLLYSPPTINQLQTETKIAGE
ncbi:unnamed protein product [Adineta steineri]|uniref:Uncharacterized protein n=1 Tax=Adineta steineri TaxID=433720 RepID=A0A815CYL5_9BILA|nr:unnamed protein product [Adineta steineri]CAF1291385.1 unnamed protein product [Adineta steineri]